MSEPVRAYLAVAVAGGVTGALALGALLLGRVVRPRRAGATDAPRAGWPGRTTGRS